MKAVLLSIRPKWCELIARGQKTIEVRKTKPKLETPFKCYIYQSQRKWLYKLLEKLSSFEWVRAVIEGQGKVIGEFICDRVYQYSSDWLGCRPADGTDISTEDMTKLSCMTAKELYDYENSAEAEDYCLYLIGLYGWHISGLKIYNKPKKLEEFSGLRETKFEYEPVKLTRPPRSWRYVEENAHEPV